MLLFTELTNPYLRELIKNEGGPLSSWDEEKVRQQNSEVKEFLKRQLCVKILKNFPEAKPEYLKSNLAKLFTFISLERFTCSLNEEEWQMVANIFLVVLKRITSEFEGLKVVLNEEEQLCFDSFIL